MLSLFPMITLMTDAARVIEIRLRMMALGKSTTDEMFLMVTEKIKAMEQAKTIIIRGGNPPPPKKTKRRPPAKAKA